MIKVEIRFPPSAPQMTSADVDMKFLGRFASHMQVNNHPLLAQSLFQIMGILTMLSGKISGARELLEIGPTRDAESVDLHHRIIWYAREGLKIVEEYIFPMVVNYQELKVLAYKLRASLYHIFVLFHNQPPIYLESGQISIWPELSTSKSLDKKGKGVATLSVSNSMQSIPPLEEPSLFTEMYQAPPYQGDLDPSFLVNTGDFRPITLQFYQEAIDLASELLDGCHPLSVSIRVEYASFLYDCLYDEAKSKELVTATISEVAEAEKKLMNEMFGDSAHLVMILKKILERTPGAGESILSPEISEKDPAG